MPMPPRFPRAMFIAALCHAGALSVKLPVARIPAPTAARIERRDRSIRNIARQLGRAIVAAGRAQQAFEKRGALWRPPEPIAPRIDKRIALIQASPAFIAAIGRPEASPHDDSPWIEVSDGDAPRVSIFWRGTRIRGERLRAGKTLGSTRHISAEDFAAAVKAARAALDAAGIKTSGFVDVRSLKIGPEEAEDEGDDELGDAPPAKAFSFNGLVATIGLARRPPIWLQPPARIRGRAL